MKSVHGACFALALCLSLISRHILRSRSIHTSRNRERPTGRCGAATLISPLTQSGKTLATTSTDGNGVYRFTSVPTGRYVVRAEAAGFSAATE